MYDTADDIESFSFNFNLHCRQDILLTFRQNVNAQVAYLKIITISLTDLMAANVSILIAQIILYLRTYNIRLLSESEFFDAVLTLM